MDGSGGKADGSCLKQGAFLRTALFRLRLIPQAWRIGRSPLLFSVLLFQERFQKRPDHGTRILGKRLRTSLRDHPAAVGSGSRPHFDDPVRLRENLRIVIHQHHRISVGNQILHHASQPHNIGGMQTDGRLIQHIQDARSAVPDRSCQLHPLPLSGGQGGGSTVQRQIAESQIQEPFCRSPEGFADALRHGPHLLRQTLRHAVYPV